MNITVILCTYNRCESLTKALGSVAASMLPESVKWEVLVVDNNSRDQTRQVVEDFCRRYPRRFRYLLEPQQGKSYALNAGIREAQGEVLAFMDDDVTVEPTWLQNLTAALHNGEWVGAGGRILPEQSFKVPRWLSLKEHASGPLVIFDLGSGPGPLAEVPYGTNMAFKKRMFEKYGLFRTDLGPQPGNEMRNEDTEFAYRLLAAGERLRYEPSAVVFHEVPESRLQKRFMQRWNFDKARGDTRVFPIPCDTKWAVSGIPLREFRRLARWALQWIFTVDPCRRFDCTLRGSRQTGVIFELYCQSRDAKRKRKRDVRA